MKFLAITLIVPAPHPVTGVGKAHQESQSDIARVLRREIPGPPSSWGPALEEPVPVSVPADH